MASIDAFFELAERQPVPNSIQRLSLRRLDSIRNSSADPDDKRQRKLILIAIGIVHVLLLLALSAAMHTPLFGRHAAEPPMLITFIERPVSPAVPKPLETAEPKPTTQPHATRPLPKIVLRPDALQATMVAPPVAPMQPVSPPATFYDATGSLQVPEASTPPHQRDLLEHRSVSFMLPGGAHGRGSHFHLQADVSPQSIVNKYGGVISGLIGSVAPRPDQNGIVLAAPDRGLHTSGRDTDPCEDVALDTLDTDPDDSRVREQADQHQEESCAGH